MQLKNSSIYFRMKINHFSGKFLSQNKNNYMVHIEMPVHTWWSCWKRLMWYKRVRRSSAWGIRRGRSLVVVSCLWRVDGRLMRIMTWCCIVNVRRQQCIKLYTEKFVHVSCNLSLYIYAAPDKQSSSHSATAESPTYRLKQTYVDEMLKSWKNSLFQSNS